MLKIKVRGREIRVASSRFWMSNFLESRGVMLIGFGKNRIFDGNFVENFLNDKSVKISFNVSHDRS